MAQNDVYELVDRQTYLGVDVYNVYHILMVGNVTPDVTPFPVRIANAFRTSFMTQIAALQSNALTHVEIAVRNLFNVNEAGSVLISDTGSRSLPVGGDYLPAWTACSLSFDTFQASFNKSSKRYAGLFEGDQSQGVLNNPSIVGGLVTLANALVTGFNLSGTGTPLQMRFCTVKRVKEVTVKGTTYRLPASLEEAEISLWNSARVPVLLKTQDSRKD